MSVQFTRLLVVPISDFDLSKYERNLYLIGDGVYLTGQMDTLLLFVSHSPLSWSYSLYGYLQGLHNGLRGLLLISLLPLLKKVGFRDSTLVLTGLVSKVAGLVLLGLSSKTWMVFLGIYGHRCGILSMCIYIFTLLSLKTTGPG